jgi:hypothetical protein
LPFVFLVVLRSEWTFQPKPWRRKGTPSGVPKQTGRRPYRSAEGWSEAQRAKGLMIAFVFAFAFLLVIPEEPALNEVEWGICFCLLPLHLFFTFSAQKSNVKSQNHPKTCQPTHNKTHISSRQSAF